MSTTQNAIKERLAPGHHMCPGCSMPLSLRMILQSTDDPIVMANSTGCMEICIGAYPYTAMRIPWIHSLFENAPSVISGVEACWKAKKRKGELKDYQKNTKFLMVGGDGAVSDIGFQWLSGAIEREHNCVFVCFDNEGYMNTGNQRSSATPQFSSTSTSPAGKEQRRKPLTEIIAAHNIPYVAQCSPSHAFDLKKKAKKAFETPGPAFLNIFTACPTNWKSVTERSLEILKLAVETNFWPLYEVENGKWKITVKQKERKAIKEFLKGQKRFAHVFKPGNEHLLEQIQNNIDRNYVKLEKMVEAFGE